MELEELTSHLHQYSKMIRELYSRNGSDLPKFVSIEEFSLVNGIALGENHELPDYVERGEIKQCFTNSSNVFMRSGGELAYCEGIAVGKKLGFPCHHAWVIDEHGQVYDPTWEYEPGEALYFGVPFADEYVFKTMQREGYYGVLAPIGMFNRLLFDGTDKPETFMHPWYSEKL